MKPNFDYERFIEKHMKHWNVENQRSKVKFYEHFIKKLVSKQKPLWVVETGTMWTRIEENAGAFTYLMSDLIMNYTGGTLTTVDISPEAIERSKENTKEFSSAIEYVTMDSVKYLKSLGSDAKMVDAFFLDSYDLFVPDPDLSEIHHFRELMAIYDNLSEDVMIGIDDNFVPGTQIHWNWYVDGKVSSSETFETGNRTIGKGRLADIFLRNEGWKRHDNIIVGENNIFLFEK